MPYKLTLIQENEHVLVLQEANRHTLTSETPIISALDYETLLNKPRINHVELVGDQSLEDLGFCPLSQHDIYILTGLVFTELDFDDVLNDGKYIELGADLTLTGQQYVTSDTDIYLCDHAIATEIDDYLFVINGVTLTIKGPGMILAEHGIARIINDGKLIVDGVEYTDEFPVITNFAYSN